MKNFTKQKLYKKINVGILISCVVTLAYSLSVNSQNSNKTMENSQAISGKQDELQFVLAGIRSRNEKIRSFQAYWVNTLYSNKNPVFTEMVDRSSNPEVMKELLRKAINMPPRLTQYFFAADGDHARYEEQSTIGWDKQNPAMVNIFDGELFYHWDPGSHLVPVSANLDRWKDTGGQFQLTLGPSPYDYGETLKSKNAYVVSHEKVGGFEAIKLESRNGVNTTHWWIAPSLDSLLVKYETINSTSNSSTGLASSRFVRFVDKVVKIDNTFVATEARELTLVTIKDPDSGKSEEMWRYASKIVASHVEVNKTIPDEMFKLILPPGITVVRSADLGGDYRVEGTKEKFKADLKRAQNAKEAPDFELINIGDFAQVSKEDRPVDPKYLIVDNAEIVVEQK